MVRAHLGPLLKKPLFVKRSGFFCFSDADYRQQSCLEETRSKQVLHNFLLNSTQNVTELQAPIVQYETV